MPTKKMTLKQVVERLKQDEDRLFKDEGAWLKSLGELGDVARLLLRIQDENKLQALQIIALEAQIDQLRKEVRHEK